MYMMRKLNSAEELVETYSNLVHRIAYHLKARLPANVMVDDLIQVGMIGLLDASHHYDPSQGASFETYATIRVRGSMLDELRRNDWAPKSVHRKARELLEVVQKLETELGREAKPADIAARMQISLDDYFKLVKDSNATRILNFVDLGGNEDSHEHGLSAHDSEPLNGLQSEQFKAHLVDAITALPEREKLVVSLYYDEEFNLREIGEILGVSESRISQLLSQAHTRMRSYMNEYLEA
jgi:RNA polymerase sigma factor for flagellar operon FliA